MAENTEKTGSKLIPIISFVAVIVIVALYGFFFLKQDDNVVQGEADVSETRISSKVPGRIAHYLVEEGAHVKRGDTLAILSIPDIEAKLAQATAAKAGAVAQENKAQKGARVEQIKSAFEVWQKAKAGLDIADKSYQRVKNLFEKGVVTAQKKDEAEANFKSMDATEKATRYQYEMARNGAEQEDKQAAVAMVGKAQGAVDEVSSYINESVLVSPLDGVVTELFPKLGELVGTGAPIMNIADSSDKWGTFNIREDKLKDFQNDGVIKVYVPALDKEVEMKIYYRKDLGSYATWKATKAAGSFDLKTFQVKARFVSDGDKILPGMSLIYKTK